MSFWIRCLGLMLALALGGGACVPAGTAGPAEVESPGPAEPPEPLPNLPDSLKFAVLGDFGTGDRTQYEMGERMAEVHTTFPFELVVTTGDNLYGSERPQDFERKFELPYKALLDRGVKFYASLGNHDSREQRSYEHFNMGGELYYSFKAPHQDVRFFALESSYPESEQIDWLVGQLQRSGEDWKIVFFHHPLYSSARRHGSDEDLRAVLEPLFVEYNVSVVLTGHDHVYERIEPQQGIPYFVVGSGGKLRRGDLGRPPMPGVGGATSRGLTAAGFDQDLAFLVAEINGDEMVFQAIARSGRIVDSGVITRRIQPAGTGPPDRAEVPGPPRFSPSTVR